MFGEKVSQFNPIAGGCVYKRVLVYFTRHLSDETFLPFWRYSVVIDKRESVRCVPAKGAIESVINIVGLLVSLVNAIYNLIMKIFFGTSY